MRMLLVFLHLSAAGEGHEGLGSAVLLSLISKVCLAELICSSAVWMSMQQTNNSLSNFLL